MKRRLLNLLTAATISRAAASFAALLLLTGLVLLAASVARGGADPGPILLAGYLAAFACGCVVVWAVASFVRTPSAGRVVFPWRLFGRRRLVRYLCGLSLLLCASTCVLWLMSQRQGYAVIFYNGVETDYAAASQGNWVAFGTHPRPSHRRPQLIGGDIPLGSAVPRYPFAAAPHAALVLAFAVLPAAWTAGHLRQTLALTRQRRGLCPRCGYDLRATPGRCPECGTAASTLAPRPGRSRGFGGVGADSPVYW